MVVKTIGLWGTSLTYWIPIFWWLLALAGLDATAPTATANFLWEFIVSCVLWIGNLLLHLFCIPTIEKWGIQHYAEPGSCICQRCDCAKDNMAC